MYSINRSAHAITRNGASATLILRTAAIAAMMIMMMLLAPAPTNACRENHHQVRDHGDEESREREREVKMRFRRRLNFG